jgi:hypothetical protein
MSMQSIFISYRREDAPFAADLIFSHLNARYKDSVFRDIDNIKPGEPFRNAIGTALRHCEVVVALVGPNWLGANDDGTMRINAPQDWVRAEIEMALQLGIPVIPVTVDVDKDRKGKMPSPEQVPETLREFTGINAVKAESGLAFKPAMERVTALIDAKRRPAMKERAANAVRGMSPRAMPPAALIACGAAALIIGWLMLQWYDAKTEDDWYDGLLSGLGPILELLGLAIGGIGIVFLVQSMMRNRKKA